MNVISQKTTNNRQTTKQALIIFSVFFVSAIILLATLKEVENTTSLYCYLMPHLQKYTNILLSLSAFVFVMFSVKTKNYKQTNFLVFSVLYLFAFFLALPAFDFHISQMCGV